jgi:hypothetical protein
MSHANARSRVGWSCLDENSWVCPSDLGGYAVLRASIELNTKVTDPDIIFFQSDETHRYITSTLIEDQPLIGPRFTGYDVHQA